MTDPNAQQPGPYDGAYGQQPQQPAQPQQPPVYPPAQQAYPAQAYPPAQQAYPQQPGYPQQYAPGQPVAYAPGDYPGKTLGIVALVFSFLWFLALVGFIMGIIAKNQSKAAGYSNTPATIAIVIGAIVFGLALIVTVVSIIIAATAVSVGGGILGGLNNL